MLQDDQIETLDTKLRSTKELIRYIENFSGQEQSQETLQRQSDKENALMEQESESGSHNDYDDEPEEEPEYDD